MAEIVLERWTRCPTGKPKDEIFFEIVLEDDSPLSANNRTPRTTLVKRLFIRGDASALLGTGLSGGEIFVKGSAAGQVGGLTPGDKFGMTGGLIVIDGHAGDRVGDRMRRGTIYIRGKCGSFAGSRMVGGTIWTELGFGADPGLLLRRGTLIGPSVEQLLPTFADAGRHDLVILPILSRYLKAKLGASAPKPLPSIVRKYTGDLATIGKGEILITA